MAHILPSLSVSIGIADTPPSVAHEVYEVRVAGGTPSEFTCKTSAWAYYCGLVAGLELADVKVRQVDNLTTQA